MKDIELAQIYIHSQTPIDTDVCRKYYRFTDVDAVKTIFNRRHKGIKFEQDDIILNKIIRNNQAEILENIYKKGRRRTPLTYLLRNLVWKLSNWYTDDLNDWIDEFHPDLIFFASGDYAFMYDIVLKISKDRKCPLVVSCFDDFYLNNTNSNSLLGKYQHKKYMKVVGNTMKECKLIICICENMKYQYEKLFQKKAIVLYTAASYESLQWKSERKKISYIGGLGLNRYKQLIVLGKALKRLDCEQIPKCIDVYSAENREEVLSVLTEENGICFHGPVYGNDMEEVLENSLLAIHTESFDENIKERVKFSISTKIAELLSRGPCILAFGPLGVASIDYLQENEAAYVINSNQNLEQKLKEIICDVNLQQQIVKNARKLAQKNHNSLKNTTYLKNELDKILLK